MSGTESACAQSLISRERNEFLKKACSRILGWRSEGTLSISDGNNRSSKEIARRITTGLGFPLCQSPPEGQSADSIFSELVREFLEYTFGQMESIRPGPWRYSTSQTPGGISAYDQCGHLGELMELVSVGPAIKASAGSDYLISPDIVITRRPLTDLEINAGSDMPIVGEPHVATCSPLRALDQESPPEVLHASISCKRTLRNGGSQINRAEGLDMVGNLKGRVPHSAVVTLEPMPTRIAAIVLGTGGVDCTYHAALNELKTAVEEDDTLADQADILRILLESGRLRDISDLPLDLAI